MAVEPAPDLAAELYVALGRVVRSLRQAAPDSEIGPGGISALATLVRSGPIRVGNLAETEGIAAASMTRIVNSLERLALVVRAPDPDDGRALVVAATDAGAQLLSSGREERLAVLRERIEALPAPHQDRLRDALGVLEELAGAGSAVRQRWIVANG